MKALKAGEAIIDLKKRCRAGRLNVDAVALTTLTEADVRDSSHFDAVSDLTSRHADADRDSEDEEFDPDRHADRIDY